MSEQTAIAALSTRPETSIVWQALSGYCRIRRVWDVNRFDEEGSIPWLDRLIVERLQYPPHEPTRKRRQMVWMNTAKYPEIDGALPNDYLRELLADVKLIEPEWAGR